MATEKAATPRPFDVKTVEYLVELMAKHDLAEIALQEGEHRVRLRKSGPPPVVMAAAPMAHPAPLPAAAPQAPGANAPDSPPPTPAGKKLHEIKSEMVGTFYAKPKPDKDEYVKAGSAVKPDTVVCQIEAMKIYNEIPAGMAGRIVEVCLKDKDFVEFGTVLFRVEPS